MDWLFDGPWFWVLAIVGVLAAIGGRYFHERRRTEALRMVARNLELVFAPEGELDGDVLGLDFELLSRGTGIRNVMSGRIDETSMQIFGYVYTTGGGRNRSTHRQTVALFTSDALDLPHFEMKPEHIGHAIASAFGYQDIDFDTHPEFSKRYVLRGPSENVIRECFRHEVLEFFAANPKLNVEGRPGGLIVYRARRRMRPRDIETFAGQAIGVFSLLVRK